MNIEEVEVIIIGGGQGAALARMLCEAGKKVALIERENLGGSCVNRGCTPTKAHIAAAKRAHDARNSASFGVHVADVTVDFPAVVARTRSIVEDFRSEIQEKLAKFDTLELIYGVAGFSGAHEVEVRDSEGKIRHLSAPEIVIATGTRSQIPEIEGLNEVRYEDSRTMLQLETVPKKLLILGGGYIACEFAQMFSRFGSHVTIAQSDTQLLTHEDEDVAGEMAEVLRRENIEVHFEHRATKVERTAQGVRCYFKAGEPIEATHLLIATGQTPNVEALNVEAAGLKTDEKGFIECDDFLLTAPGIHVLGDIKGGPAFTHTAYDDARILGAILLGKGRRSFKDRPVPYCVFTDPQLGRVGMTESEAREKGVAVRVAKIDCTETARGIESGESDGFLKVIVEAESGEILGGAFICSEGGEIMAVLEVAMMGKLPYQALRDAVLAHPTWAESFNNLFAHLDREVDCV